jgi:hypothetical protein
MLFSLTISNLERRLKEFFDHYLKGNDAKKWMVEELPFTSEEESKEKDLDKRTLPKWQ